MKTHFKKNIDDFIAYLKNMYYFCNCNLDITKTDMNNRVTHSGTIEKIDGGHIVVKIIQTSACSSCKVAGHCNASEMKEKFVDVFHADTRNYKIGDAVKVSTDTSAGYRAVGWGFGIPMLILIEAVFAVKILTGNDARAALIGIASLIPYYMLLYLLRHKIRKRLSFKIE